MKITSCLSLLSATALFALPAFAQADLIQVGYSFNQGSSLPADRSLIDYYRNVDGYLSGTVAGGTFSTGYTAEPGDYSLTPKWGPGTNPAGTAYAEFAINQVAGFDNTWSDFTIEVHFKFGGNNQTLIGFDTSGNDKFKIMGGASGGTDRLRLFERGGANYYSGTLTQDTWYHVAITYSADTNQMTTYLNGTKFGSTVTIDLDALLGAPDRIILGAHYTDGTGAGTGGIWTSPIDDFRFTNAVLSPDQFLMDGFGDQVMIPEPRVASLLGGIAALGAILYVRARAAR